MFNSIRTKLTLWYVGVLAVVIIGFSTGAYFMLANALSRETDESLVEMGHNFESALRAELEDENGAAASDRAISEAVNEMRFRDYQFQIVTADGRVIASTADSSFLTNELNCDEFQIVNINNEPQRVYLSPLANGKDQNKLLVFHSLREQNRLMARLAGIFFVSLPISLILAGFGGYFLARKSLAPMVEMGRQAAQIGAQNLHERIQIKNKTDELGDLAAVFNELLSRLDASFEQQRRFMADASHELRTPLAIVRGEAEVALSKDDRTTAEYKESLSILHDESKRLTKIVEDLFTLARADAGQFNAAFAPVYLDEIVGEAVRSMRVLAERQNIGISVSGATEMSFNGDESLLRRLFLNLLDNAVKYSRPGGKVSVDCISTEMELQIDISDNGIGIPQDEQPKIFERFYRVDKARVRGDETATSGAGLGLSIARWIAEIHNGKITLASTGEDGSVFTVIFPR